MIIVVVYLRWNLILSVALVLQALLLQIILVLLLLVLHVPLVLTVHVVLFHLILALALLLAQRYPLILRIESIPSSLHVLLKLLFIGKNSFMHTSYLYRLVVGLYIFLESTTLAPFTMPFTAVIT